MNELSATERLTVALARATEHWESGRQTAERGVTIAISRQVGARGSSVARELGRRLNWPVYDHELLEMIAREMNVRSNLLESVDEKHKSWLQEQVEAFSAIPYVSENAFVRQVIETVLMLGLHGECVIVGRGAPHILPTATTLRVRLIAERDDRIELMAREWNLPLRDAQRKVDLDERDRVQFIKDHFHKDVVDPAGYDLVLNASRFSVANCAEIVIGALRQVQHPAARRERASAS